MANRHYNPLLYLYSFSLFVLFLQSMKAWFLLYVNGLITSSIAFIIGVLYLFTRKGALRIRSWIVPLLAIAAYFWMRQSPNFILGILGGLLRLFSVTFFLLLLSRDELKIVLSVITKLFALLLFVSIIFYIIGFVIPIPSIGSIYELSGFYNFDIHIFYLTNNNPTLDGLSDRFMSVFLEPGFLGHICAFMLYANNYKFKDFYNIVILIALIMSFSLAGFMLLAIGLLIDKVIFSDSPKKYRRLAIISVLFSSFVAFGVFYNGGDNYVNDLILSRLAYDEENGIEGNKRVVSQSNIVFLSAVANGEIVTGLGSDYFEKNYPDMPMGAGIKMYMITQGIVGVLLVFLFYLSIVMTGSNKRMGAGMLVLYSAAFLDVSFPFWTSWLIPFICVVYGNKGEDPEPRKVKKKEKYIKQEYAIVQPHF